MTGAPLGTMTPDPPDRRRHAWRADLAARGLEGRVPSLAFVEGVRHQVAAPAVALRREPRAEAGIETEALFGEVATVYETKGGWAWVQLVRDGYVGYVPEPALSAVVQPATHRVAAMGTFLYPVADIKAPPRAHLSLNAALSVQTTGERFLELANGGFVIARHASEIGRHARDFVEIAERFIGTPYLWGGRTRLGVDCSGLLQLAMEAAGLACPRDSDMQEAEVGTSVLVPSDLEGLKRGDLVFWRGHVGLMVDGLMLLHANAHHMAVVAEPLSHAVTRIARTGGPITSIRRPAALCG